MKNYEPILMKFSEQELKSKAEEWSKYIRFGHGDIREATVLESSFLSKIIYGALLSIRWRDDAAQVAMDTAEMIADLIMPDLNGYDSVYLPINKILRELENEQRD